MAAAAADNCNSGSCASLTFALNGEKVVLNASDVDPTMTLNEFIRSKTKYKGTKLACGEGGCGACAVVLSRVDTSAAGGGEPVYVSANSCLRPVASMDGWSVTTTEGLGAVDSAKGLHPVQARMASMNATQCGFCTPGMVCTLYAKLKQSQSKANAAAGAAGVAGAAGGGGDGGVTMQEMEQTYDGNICRCTGYRPILDAAKTFAKDTDIEDLVCKSTPKGAAYDAKLHDPVFPEFLKHHRTPARATFAAPSTQGKEGRVTWHRAAELADVFAQFDAHPTAGDVKLIWANTGSGIFKTDKPKVLVDISGLPALMRLEVTPHAVTIGAGYSLTAFLNVCKMLGQDDDEKKTHKAPWSEAFQRHVLTIANTHVRNVGSIGGNVMLAKNRGFQSDLSTLLLGANAVVSYAVRGAAKGSVTTSSSMDHAKVLQQFVPSVCVCVCVRL